MSNQKFYTTRELAALLQVHWLTVLNYINKGELEAVRLGKGYRISNTALESFLKNRSTKSRRQKP